MKKGPTVLIGILTIAAMFILGMQYGKQVEKTNKVFSFLLSITPSPSPTMKETKLIFSEYQHKGCGISFTKPVEFKTTKESTRGATLAYNKQIISFACPKEEVNKLEKTDKTTATSSVILNNKKLQGYTEGQNIRFVANHPYRKIPIMFSIDNNLLPLIQSSLEFTK